MGDFEKELQAGFLAEAVQLLNEAEQCFLALEADPNDKPTIEQIFRIAHNIKGSAKAVGLDALGAFTHEFESYLIKCKNGEIPITPTTISLLLKCNDHIKQFIDLLGQNPEAILDGSALVAELVSGVSAEAPAAAPEATQAAPAETQEAFTISAEEIALLNAHPEPEIPPVLEAPLAPAAPVLAAEPAVPSAPEAPAAQHAPNGASAAGATATADESIRVSVARLEKLLNYVGELVILQTVLREQAYTSNPAVLRRSIHQIGKVTKEIQDLSMSLRMVPLKQTMQKMTRIVRDTSGILGKKVRLVLQGEETEVDKTVLENLSDPLVHIIRNAVDHGIESPQDRVAKGKPEQGEIKLHAYHQAGGLVIEIRDDGGGIPAQRLRQKALEKGILRPGQVISDKEAIALIFHPGFSTKAEVTEVSGRGVGMDVVKTNIERMQGEVVVDTVEGKGSVFRITLPLTLAIIDGMVVRCGEDRFVIPLSQVHESTKPRTQDIQFATGVGEVLLLRGENLPVVRLASSLGRKAKVVADDCEQIAIIVRTAEQPFAALVDDIVGQHQVVIKKLGSELQNVRGYSGSAILGDGKPALILEMSELARK
jgi:two-component system, chemotaxis family, sensor kinase CheA